MVETRRKAFAKALFKAMTEGFGSGQIRQTILEEFDDE